MVKINLLPHRQMARAERKRQLGLMAMVTVALGIVLILMGHQMMQTRLDNQTDRNTRLQNAISKLDIQIEEIRGLQEEIKTMLDKKQVVENLQSNRSQAVVLLDEITRQLPEAVFLNSLKQSGNTITLQGFADTNGRVATLVRNLSTSRWLEAPALIEIHTAEINNQKMSNFTLTVKQKVPDNSTSTIPSGKDKKA